MTHPHTQEVAESEVNHVSSGTCPSLGSFYQLFSAANVNIQLIQKIGNEYPLSAGVGEITVILSTRFAS